jgi:SSS family transporter
MFADGLAALGGSLRPLDLVVVVGYLVVSLGLGLALSRQSNRDEFLTAGRSMGRITVGLSVMATLFSANSFVMYPSTAYGDSLKILLAAVAFMATTPLVVWVFIPVYSKLNCNTAYEYLEQRFHVSVRCLASSLFVVLRIAWMAAATFAASVAISGISGLDQYVVIIGLGVVAIVYTMFGGLRAVMWTDVIQFFVFFGTILFAAGLLISKTEGGASEIVETYFTGRENLVFDFRLDPTVRFGTFAILIGSFLEGLSSFGADQVAVQRYISARDARTSQVGFVVSQLGMLIVIPGLLAIGMGLFSYFHHNPDMLSDVAIAELQNAESSKVVAVRTRLAAAGIPGGDQAIATYYSTHPRELHADIVTLGLHDQALPRFVRLKFPPGVVGLLVAALMAATMSSVDSGIHSITTTLIIDFRDRLVPKWRPKTEAGEMLVARILVVLIGVIAITLACFVGQLGDVFAVAKKTVGAFSAPLLAVFVLGLFVRRTTATGVFLGTFAGAVVTLWFTFAEVFSDWFSLWVFVVGFVSSVVFSLLLSLVPGLKLMPDGARNRTYWAVVRDDAVARPETETEASGSR